MMARISVSVMPCASALGLIVIRTQISVAALLKSASYFQRGCCTPSWRRQVGLIGGILAVADRTGHLTGGRPDVKRDPSALFAGVLVGVCHCGSARSGAGHPPLESEFGSSSLLDVMKVGDFGGQDRILHLCERRSAAESEAVECVASDECAVG